MKVTENWFAMKLEQEKLRNLLTDTILLLCNNGLKFKQELKVEGLIGITVDSEEVFLVHLNESRKGKDVAVGGLVHSTTSGERERHMSSDSEGSQVTKRRRRKRKSTPSHLALKELQVDPPASTSALNNAFFPLIKIKKEKDDCNYNGDDGSAIDLAGAQLQSAEESGGIPSGKNNSDLSCMMTSESLAPLSGSNQGWLEGSDVPGRLQLFPDWSPQSLQALSVAQQMRMPPEFTTDLTHCTPRRPRNGLKPFACPLPFCAKSFYYKHHLKRHIRLKHKEYIQVVPPVVVGEHVGALKDFGHIDLTAVASNLMQGQYLPRGRNEPPDEDREDDRNAEDDHGAPDDDQDDTEQNEDDDLSDE